MFKSHFDEITISDLLSVLQDECPQLKLDIECFMNELSKEDELMQSTMEDVLSSYDSELYREAYYGTSEPTFTGKIFYHELRQALEANYPSEKWIMTGDYQVRALDNENREQWVVYEDERRKAQFTSKDGKQMIEVEYRYMSNHKTDGIEIVRLKRIRG